MNETKGPSTTIPPSEPTRSPQTLSQQSQHPQATMAGPEPTVSQTAPTTERLQTVPGFDSRSPGQGQNMSTGGFRSSSVPSEDEVSQLYPNEGEGGQVSALKSNGVCMVLCFTGCSIPGYGFSSVQVYLSELVKRDSLQQNQVGLIAVKVQDLYQRALSKQQTLVVCTKVVIDAIRLCMLLYIPILLASLPFCTCCKYVMDPVLMGSCGVPTGCGRGPAGGHADWVFRQGQRHLWLLWNSGSPSTPHTSGESHTPHCSPFSSLEYVGIFAFCCDIAEVCIFCI